LLLFQRRKGHIAFANVVCGHKIDEKWSEEGISSLYFRGKSDRFFAAKIFYNDAINGFRFIFSVLKNLE